MKEKHERTTNSKNHNLFCIALWLAQLALAFPPTRSNQNVQSAKDIEAAFRQGAKDERFWIFDPSATA
jgi:hypothetical protein